jgi:hypothetical protein
MAVIRNNLNQRLIINLTGGRNIDLLARGTMNVSEKELSSPHLRTLIAKGDISVIQAHQPKESIEMGTRVIKKQVQTKKKAKK